MVAKRRWWTAAGAILAALALVGGCHPATVRTPPAPTTTAPAPSLPTATAGPAGTHAFRIDPEHTVVTIVVRRAGALARLGHDHVVTSTDETGTVWLGATPAASSFELQLPVERFDVDLPQIRATAGPEFAAPVPDDARAGTHRNMLRTEVLDAAHYPVIALRSLGADGDWASAVVRIAVTLKGVEREPQVPVVIERQGDRLVARGTLRLRQGDFGMTPFSVGGGAIQVADVLEVRFELVAVAT